MTREEAIYRLNNTAWLGSNKDRVATEQAVQMAIEALSDVPDTNVGKWIIKSNITPWYTEWWYECSECGQKPLRDGYEQEVLSDYCPSCGCRMERDEE